MKNLNMKNLIRVLTQSKARQGISGHSEFPLYLHGIRGCVMYEDLRFLSHSRYPFRFFHDGCFMQDCSKFSNTNTN